MMAGKFFIQLVKVAEVRGTAPNLVVDLLPLMTQVDATGAGIDNSIVHNCPVFRLQRGASAVVMDPVPGDIGYAAICDGDTTLVRRNREPAVPGSKREHSMSDGIYMGGLLNAVPTEYIQFLGNQINIVTPGSLQVNAPNGATFTMPNLHVTGDITSGGNITDNSGSQSASLKALRDAYNAHTHPVPGVQSGGSTVTSNQTAGKV